MKAHVTNAANGFLRSIKLGKEGSHQDMMRLLTLWFNYITDSRSVSEQFEAELAKSFSFVGGGSGTGTGTGSGGGA